MKKIKRASFRHQLSISILRSSILSFSIAIFLSFLVFYPILRKNAIEEAKNTNMAVLQRLENTFSFVESYMENTAMVVEQNNSIKKYFQNPTTKNKTAASVTLNNLASYMGMIRGIAVASGSSSIIDSMANFTEKDYALLESEIFREMEQASFSRSYFPVYQTSVAYNDYCTVAYARNFYLNSRWYTIIIFVNLNNAINDIRTLVGNDLDAYYLLDSSGQNFYWSGEEKDVRVAVELAGDGEVKQRESASGDIVFSEKSTVSGYGVVSLVKRASIFSLLFPYTVGLFLSMLGFLILTLYFTSRNVNAMINPVIDLSHHMLRAAGGDLDCKVETTRQDEIGQLERSFNKMIDDLKRDIEVISEKEAREQRIKFSLLVSQIDPHFIYNTINSINYLARKERCADIIKVNTALIAILRDRLRVNDIQITDTIANEVRVVNQYILIEDFMYGGNLTTEWDVDKELMEEQIPKNMIQPLVENAFFHGLIDEDTGELNGTLRIGLHRDEKGNIVLCVEDDGVGMEKEKLLQVRNEQFVSEERGAQIGLANIRGRLYYLYGNESCLEIDSGPNVGTRITITFAKK